MERRKSDSTRMKRLGWRKRSLCAPKRTGRERKEGLIQWQVSRIAGHFLDYSADPCNDHDKLDHDWDDQWKKGSRIRWREERKGKRMKEAKSKWADEGEDIILWNQIIPLWNPKQFSNSDQCPTFTDNHIFIHLLQSTIITTKNPPSQAPVYLSCCLRNPIFSS